MGWDDPAFDDLRGDFGASPVETYAETLSRKVGLDPYYTKLLLQRETGGLDDFQKLGATSSAGALGPLQVMPATGEEMAKKYGFDFGTPEGKMEAGVRYYKDLLDKYQNPSHAAAAYHSGPGRVSEILGRGGDLSQELGPVGRDYYDWFNKQVAAKPPATPQLPPPPSMEVAPPLWKQALEGTANLVEKTYELPGLKQFSELAGAQKHALEKSVLAPALGYDPASSLGTELTHGVVSGLKGLPAPARIAGGLAAGVGGALVDVATDPLTWELMAAGTAIGSALGPAGAAAGGILGTVGSILKNSPRLLKGLVTGFKAADLGFKVGMAQHVGTDIPRGIVGIVEDPTDAEGWAKIGGGTVSGYFLAHPFLTKTPLQLGKVKFSTLDAEGNPIPLDAAIARQLAKPGIMQVAGLLDTLVSAKWQVLKEKGLAPDVALPELHLIFGSGESRAFSQKAPDGGGRLGIDIAHLIADAEGLKNPETRGVFIASWLNEIANHEITHLLKESGVDHTLPLEFRREVGELTAKVGLGPQSILGRPGAIPPMSWEEFLIKRDLLLQKHGLTLDRALDSYGELYNKVSEAFGAGEIAALLTKLTNHPDPLGFVERYKTDPHAAWAELNFTTFDHLYNNLTREVGEFSLGMNFATPEEVFARFGGTPLPGAGLQSPMGTIPPPPMMAAGEKGFGKGGKPGSKKGRRGYYVTVDEKTSAKIPDVTLRAGAEHPEYAADVDRGTAVEGGIPTRPIERGATARDLTPILPERPKEAQAEARTIIEKNRLLNQIARQRPKMEAAGDKKKFLGKAAESETMEEIERAIKNDRSREGLAGRPIPTLPKWKNYRGETMQAEGEKIKSFDDLVKVRKEINKLTEVIGERWFTPDEQKRFKELETLENEVTSFLLDYSPEYKRLAEVEFPQAAAIETWTKKKGPLRPGESPFVRSTPDPEALPRVVKRMAEIEREFFEPKKMEAAGEKEGPREPKSVAGKLEERKSLFGPQAPELKKITQRNISGDLAPRLKTEKGVVRAPGFGPPPKEKKAIVRGPSLGRQRFQDAVKRAMEATEAEKKMKAEGEGKITSMAEFKEKKKKKKETEFSAYVEKVVRETERELLREDRERARREHLEYASERTSQREEWIKKPDKYSMTAIPGKLGESRRKAFIEEARSYILGSEKPSNAGVLRIAQSYFPDVKAAHLKSEVLRPARIPLPADYAKGYDYGLSFFGEEMKSLKKKMEASGEEELSKQRNVKDFINRSMKAAGEDDWSVFSTGSGEGFKRMFVQRIYGDTVPGTTWAKEVVQNILDTFDDVRDAGDPNFIGHATIGYDSKNGILTAKDNGTGISPEFLRTGFLDPGKSGKRGQDRRGNFGIAKMAIMGVGDPFEVTTVWKDPQGNKIETKVRGTGATWIGKNEAEISTPKIVHKDTPTGTEFKVTLDKDIAGFGEKGVRGEDIEDYIKKTMSSTMLDDKIRLVIDGVEQDIKKGASWFRPAVVQGAPPAAGRWTPDYGTASQKKELFTSPEADYEVFWRPASYESHSVTMDLYNRGQLQSEGYGNNMRIDLGEPIKGLPTNIRVNVKAKVPATDKDYPWEFDRKNLKPGAKEIIKKWIEDKIAEGKRATASQYQQYEADAPSIGDTQHKLLLPEHSLDPFRKQPEKLKEILEDPATKELALALFHGAEKFRKAMMLPAVKFHLGYSNEWYGLNTPRTWYKDGKGRILLNPWTSLKKVQESAEFQKALAKRTSEMGDPRPGAMEETYAEHANLLATEMLATSLHELTHETDRGHGESFAGALTRASARGLIVGAKAWRPLAEFFSDPRNIRIIREQAQFFESLSQSYNSPFSGAVSERVPGGREAGAPRPETGRGAEKADQGLLGKIMKAEADDIRNMANDLRPDIVKALRGRLHSSTKGTKWEGMGLLELKKQTGLPKYITDVMEKLESLGATAGEVDRVEGFEKYDPLWEKLGAPRALITSGDLSGILRQGVIGTARLGFSHPIKLAKAIKDSVVALAKEDRFQEAMKGVEDSPDFQFMKDLGIDFTRSEEQFGGARFVDGVFKRVTGGRWNFVRGSERAYTYYLNRLRYELGKHHLDSLRKLGFEASMRVNEEGQRFLVGDDVRVYEKMADWVNIATGRGQLPKGQGKMAAAVRSMDKFLNMVFFSPRLILARIATLNPHTYASAFNEMRKHKGAIKATRAMASMHIADLAAYAGLVSASTAMLSALFGAETEWDMTSSDFGQMRMGNTRVDVTGGLRTYITTAARILSGETKTEYGVVKPQQARETILKFFQGKLGPLPSLGLTLAEGQNLVGDPAYGPLKDVLTGQEPITPEVLKEILKVTGGTISQQTVMPMVVSDMQRLLTQNEFDPLQIAVLMSAATLGAGVSTREEKPGLGPMGQKTLRGTSVEPLARPSTVSTPFKDALGNAIELKLPYMVRQHLQENSDKSFYEIMEQMVSQDSFQAMPPAAQRMVVLQLLTDARAARAPLALQKWGSQRFLPEVEKARVPEVLSRLMPPPPGIERQKRWTDVGDWI